MVPASAAVADVAIDLRHPDAEHAATEVVVSALWSAAAGDDEALRRTMAEGAAVLGWPVLARRLDVALRGLAYDAGLEVDPDVCLLDLTAELASAAPWADPATVAAAGAVLADRLSPSRTPQPSRTQVWPLLALVAYLADRLGYPPDVVA